MSKNVLNHLFDQMWKEVQVAYAEEVKSPHCHRKYKSPTITHDDFVQSYRIAMSVEDAVQAILDRQYEVGESKASYYVYKSIPNWGDDIGKGEGKSKYGSEVIVATNLSWSDAKQLQTSLQTIWDQKNPDHTRWTSTLFLVQREKKPEIKERSIWFSTVEIRGMLEVEPEPEEIQLFF